MVVQVSQVFAERAPCRPRRAVLQLCVLGDGRLEKLKHLRALSLCASALSPGRARENARSDLSEVVLRRVVQVFGRVEI